MRIYGALLSPFVRKVCVAAAEKGVDYELAPARARGEIDPGFIAASPLGKMPALIDGDYRLADSSAMLFYIDAKVPAPPLIPAEARARGRAVWFDEFADTMLGASGLKILFNRLVGPKFMGVPGDEAVAAQGEAELPRLFAYLEGVAPAAGWLAGEEFSIGDIAVASMIRTLMYVAVEPKAAEYPAIAAWYARVCARPAWQQVAAQEDAARR